MERKLFCGEDYCRLRGRGSASRSQAIPIAYIEAGWRTSPPSSRPKAMRNVGSAVVLWSYLLGILDTQICAIPPSTQSSLPFTKAESSEARNRAVVAISSGRPSSFRGIPDRKYSFASAGRFASALVAIGPGLSTFTRILRSASSTAHYRAKDRSAALLPA